MFRRAVVVAAAMFIAGPILADPPPASSDQVRGTEKMPPFDRLDRVEQLAKRIDEQLTRFIEQTSLAMQKDIAELRDEVGRLRKEFAELRSMPGREPIVARKPIDSQIGTVMLLNEHPTMMMDAVVNGVTHRLLPGGSESVVVPAGSLMVQVLQTDPMVRSRTLLPGETKVITMR